MATYDDMDMSVTKRNGNNEPVSFDKILNRIKTIGQEVGIKLNYTSLAMKVIDQIYDKIPTTKIDEISAEQCASMASIHPDYNILAGRIIISNHQKNTCSSFSQVMSQLYTFQDNHKKSSPLISKKVWEIVEQNTQELDDLCDYSRDYLIDYFGFKTLERAYLMKVNKTTVERIQHMWLRVSIGIHGNNLKRVKETYQFMSQKYFIHATPTLFNSGTPHPQMSSCYLQALESDSIEGIYNTLKECAMISKWAGGIGLHIHNARATGSHIRGTNGSSNGIVPMLRVFNNTAKYVDQCLDPSTIVFTKRGAIPIKNIVIGDSVVTDDGEYYEIGKILDNEYTGDMYTINVANTMTPIKMTDMHPLWVIKTDSYFVGEAESKTEPIRESFSRKSICDDKFKIIKNDIIEQLERNQTAPEFIEAKFVTKNDFIGFPIPKYEKDIEQYTEDDCRMYGILIGCGIYTNNTVSVTINDINEKDNTTTLDFIKDYLDKINIKLKYLSSFLGEAESETKHLNMLKEVKYNSIKISWKRNNMFNFTYEMLHDEYGNKRLMQSFLHLPRNKTLCFIKGLLESNGNLKDQYILFENISKYRSANLMENIRYIFLRIGILASCIIFKNSIFKNPKHPKMEFISVLKIPKTPLIGDLLNIEPSENFSFFEFNDYIFSPVKTTNRIKNYTGRVIDIEVNNEDHHNLLTNSGLVKNGGGKRSGSFAIYLEPWHADIELFLQMRKNHGDEEMKARDLFYAIWMPDLFMTRVKSGGNLTLMCPDECPGLSDVYGDEFVQLYEKYENLGKGRKTVLARDLWFQILDAQMETGTPYIVYKDACNIKSNQKNLGTIKSSNLCTEIIQYSDSKETAVCNLASIGLPTYIDKSQNPPIFDYEKLHAVTKIVTYNLNQVIDVNFYPTGKTKESNFRHRPIGIGVQGLADVFMILGLPFGSPEAREINRKIFETIYHAALEESSRLSEELGPYESFTGSPASKGILQFDMWNVNPTDERYNWTNLKKRIKTFGLRNSLLLAPMPTASTSQILGFNECFEPITSNIYSRRTIAGEFIMANKYLMEDLIQLDLWNEKIKNNIIANNGSIQQLEIIPEEIREKYKTVWELPMKTIIDYAADRGAYICQSQSLNLWLEDPSYTTLTSMHFYGWNKGLKTGIYYLRRRGAHKAQQFTIEVDKKDNGVSIEEDEICESCSA